MKALVVYDSFFGNTEQIARAVAAAISTDAQALRVGDVTPDQLSGLDLLVVGSPTRAFRPSPLTQSFLKTIVPGSLTGVRVAGFDTRIAPEDAKSGFLKLMIKLFGYAAKPISSALLSAGGSPALPPEGFAVKDSEGPLKAGELERAAEWGKKLAATSAQP